ncbi:hypothetical protein MRB53_039899 [Persea americana]|nr:hypothetical protein MRB53_039899 [Persea americana]
MESLQPESAGNDLKRLRASARDILVGWSAPPPATPLSILHRYTKSFSCQTDAAGSIRSYLYNLQCRQLHPGCFHQRASPCYMGDLADGRNSRKVGQAVTLVDDVKSKVLLSRLSSDSAPILIYEVRCHATIFA